MAILLSHFGGSCKNAAIQGKIHHKDPRFVVGVCSNCGLIVEKYERSDRIKEPDDEGDDDDEPTLH